MKRKECKAFDIPTIDISLKNDVINGYITLEEAQAELVRSGHTEGYSKNNTMKFLGLDKEPNVKLKERITKEEYDILDNKDFKSLTKREQDNLITYISYANLWKN